MNENFGWKKTANGFPMDDTWNQRETRFTAKGHKHGGISMIIYRPHRGGLARSLSEAKTFTDTASMKKYIQYNGDIYDIYLDYMSPQDIHVYSIDESFLDVTDYLRMYKKTAREFAKFLINEIAERTHI